MTVSSHTKMFKQLASKPTRLKKYKKHNTPNERGGYGKRTKACERCGGFRGHISKYNLHFCRRCFRQYATNLGFKKFS